MFIIGIWASVARPVFIATHNVKIYAKIDSDLVQSDTRASNPNKTKLQKHGVIWLYL